MTHPHASAEMLIMLAWVGIFIFVVADYFTTDKYNRQIVPPFFAILAVSALAVIGMYLVGGAP